MIMLKDATCATGRASDTRRLGTPLAAPPLAPAAPPTRYYRYAEIFAFLDAVDLCGKSIPTKVQDHPDTGFSSSLSPAHHRRAPPIHRCRTTPTGRSTPRSATCPSRRG